MIHFQNRRNKRKTKELVNGEKKNVTKSET